MVSLSLFLFLTGCGGQKDSEALNTDANGYICPKCKLKFYTDRAVSAQVCPDCKTVAATTVMGFVCPKDKHTTISTGTETGKSITAVCEKCNGTVESIRLPNTKELQAWGAVKKTQQEVSR